MLCLLVALLYLYLSAGVHMFSTWREAHRDSAAVVALEREHAALVRAHASLGQRSKQDIQDLVAGFLAQRR